MFATTVDMDGQQILNKTKKEPLALSRQTI